MVTSLQRSFWDNNHNHLLFLKKYSIMGNKFLPQVTLRKLFTVYQNIRREGVAQLSSCLNVKNLRTSDLPSLNLIYPQSDAQREEINEPPAVCFVLISRWHWTTAFLPLRRKPHSGLFNTPVGFKVLPATLGHV